MNLLLIDGRAVLEEAELGLLELACPAGEGLPELALEAFEAWLWSGWSDELPALKHGARLCLRRAYLDAQGGGSGPGLRG